MVEEKKVEPKLAGKVIQLNTKQHEKIKLLNNSRNNLEGKKRQTDEGYINSKIITHKIFVSAREIRAQIEKNIKEWGMVLGKIGDKAGVDLMKVNYHINYETGVLTPPTEEEQKKMEAMQKNQQPQEVDTKGIELKPKIVK